MKNTSETIETIAIPANRATRRGTEPPNSTETHKYVFVAKPTTIKNHTDHTFSKMYQDFNSGIINDKPKFQRPDVDGTYLKMGDGNPWQQQLMQDIIIGNPFQPIHLRLKNGVWEIIDGGHRTRTVIKFLHGFVRLPEGTIITDADGNTYDLSGMNFPSILRKYEFLSEYIWNLKFEVYEYHNMTDLKAEQTFLKLNNLHSMSDADKRNAIDNIIADICRERGAVDSPNALSIFNDYRRSGKTQKLTWCSVPMNKRKTDEMVSYALWYLYSGGIFNDDLVGLANQSKLNDMYRNEDLIKRLLNPNDTLLSDLDSLLKIVTAIVKEGPISTKNIGKWGEGSIKKLYVIITESAWLVGGFDKYNPDVKKLHTELKAAWNTLNKSQEKHHPYQRYSIIDNKVTPLPTDQQKNNKGDLIKNIKYHESYQFGYVWTGGARVDDLLWMWYQLTTLNVSKFGLKTSTKDSTRTFTEKQNAELWAEQNGECKKCGCDLNTSKSAADHILGHCYGGPTETRNGQLLCKPCNDMKSSGMDIDDVKYLCEKYGSDEFDSISKFVLQGDTTLNEHQIKAVKKLIIK